ncbi:hypothetical protein MA9V1_057 [Chryseobacterium phage MA9V-1]|nr:hypothetical protein MA9V1_057 [Chryseobacterium phage MA9V-1]
MIHYPNPLRRIISAGTKVTIDDRGCYDVVRQSNNFEYTWVTDGKSTWEVRTLRITLI